MGIYADYLDKQFDFKTLTTERKKQLAKIAQLRERDVLVIAADLNKGIAPISINYSDILPLEDQLQNLSGNKLDLILETPGGSGEIAEDIVRLIRQKYTEVGIIIPGYAKSAGTIIAMSADEILMGKSSALGPIDAQLQWQGKNFSADALIEGLEKIKQEVLDTNALNKAYIPILQGISPGELQAAQNAKNFAIQLVKEWLVKYKFQHWREHTTSSPGQRVTDFEKETRAGEIACELSNHNKWLTHGRSLKIEDLKKIKLQITDYSKIPDLSDAITRYFVLLQMTFQTNIYKIFETQSSQIYRFISPNIPTPKTNKACDSVVIDVQCNQCGKVNKVQAGLDKKISLQTGNIPFPTDNKLKCTNCNIEIDLSDTRRQIEAQTKKRIT